MLDEGARHDPDSREMTPIEWSWGIIRAQIENGGSYESFENIASGLGGAVMLFAAGSVAQAADSPDAVKGREPVWRCDTAGFIEYPGSDLCFKIGGHVVTWIGGADENWTTDGGTRGGIDEYGILDDIHTVDDTFWMGARGRFNIDIRNATEFGIVRGFMEFEATDTNSNSGGSVGFRHGFIQIGNWLMGKTWSTFRSAAGTPEVFSEPLGAVGDQRTVRIVQLRYSFKLGNGVTVNVAIEDPAFHWTNGALDQATFSRHEAPDFVANIQVTGSWGKAQLSGAVHQASMITTVGVIRSEREIGWATMASLALNVPGTMGDVIYLAASYADGHVTAIDTGAAFGWHAHTAGHGGGAVDAVTAWAVVVGWEHYWMENLRSTVAASYVDNDYPATPPASVIDNATSVWANLIWTLSKGLDVGVEVIWGQNELFGPTAAACAAATGAASCKGSAIAGTAQAIRKF